MLRNRPERYRKITLPVSSKKRLITGIKIIGDSLSDRGDKYGEYSKRIGCIPIRLFLHRSPYKQFTNGFVWEYPLIEKLKFLLKETAKPLDNPYLAEILSSSRFSENVAQGGSTAYNYGRFFSFFRHIKGFFLSFFLNNIQRQAKTLRKNSRIDPDDLCLIFAGANDLVTLGYCNEGGVDRAIEGIAKTIKMLAVPGKTTNKQSYSKNVLLFTLPDFSKTPRFSKKTRQEREQAEGVCHSFNQKLKDLAKTYQYIDFSFCDIYQISDKDRSINLDAIRSQIPEKGVILVGEGACKTVYFVEKKEFIAEDSGKIIALNVRLSKAQQSLLGSTIGKVKRGPLNTMGLDDLIGRLSRRARLNTEVKLFDAAAVFSEIAENPEAYGFTGGCAVYYLSDSAGEEAILKTIFSGNALVFKRLSPSGQVLCYFIQEGRLLRDREISLQLFPLEAQQFEEKIKKYPFNGGISQLAASEDKHDTWMVHLIQRAIRAYERSFQEKIRLADIYVSILTAIKEHLPNQEQIFWDDLHPTVTVHFLLELMFERFFVQHYRIKNPKTWLDDTLLLDRIEPIASLPPKAYEAPARMCRSV